MQSAPPLHQLVPAVHSPLSDHGELAADAVRLQARFLAAQGLSTVFVTGSTGEGHSLTVAERRILFREWSAASDDSGLTVIAQVGSNALGDAQALARHAQEVNLFAISAAPPSYYRPHSVAALVDWCAAVAAEAPELPFYYYDIPALTGVDLPMERFLVEAGDRIPTLAGIKFARADLTAYRRTLDVAGDRFDLPWGVDETLLGALATGARGAVGSTFNWAPQLYRNLMASFAAGDLTEARRWQGIAIAMIDAIAATGYLGTAKALMCRLGVPVGPARSPIDNPTTAQVDALLTRLGELGFGKWGARWP